jgi:ABC-type uncharacterized transport system involved in gliding motility auxiliary subunit
MAKKSASRKKSAARLYAPAGLWLSGIAVLVGIVVLAIKLIAFMGIYAPTDEIRNVINGVGIGSLAAFVMGVALFALLDPKRVRKILQGRQAKHGSNAFITLTAVTGIIFVVNLIAYQNPKAMDWTQDKSHTLAPETIATLEALPEPVEAIGFFTANYSSTSAEELLTDFRNNSGGKFDYRFVNPESNPTLAQQYNVTRDGTIVFVMGDRQELISYASEQNITNALVRLINPEQRVVYFLTGHGESEVENAGETAYTRVRSLLTAKNYTVQTLNLRAENQIPEDAVAIVIAGPRGPISESEASLLQAYLEGGGSLVILEDPTVLTSKGNEADAFETYLAQAWGVTFNNDIVIDPSSNPLTFAISYSYGSHPITDEMLASMITFFPVARSLTVSIGNTEMQSSGLVYTIERAWGETNFDSIADNTFQYQAGEDIGGPILLASAIENTATQARLVVFGNSSFANDTYVDQYGNADLIINAIDWAAKQDELISLTVKTGTTRTLMPISTFAWLMLGLLFILIIPGLIIAGGVVSWLVRRAKG